MPTMTDSRYSTSLEFCGATFPNLLPGQAYVLRFCGEWVNKFGTLAECQTAGIAHDNARMGRAPLIEVRHNGVAFIVGNWEGTPSASGGIFRGINPVTGERVNTGLALNVKGRTFHTL